MFRSAPQPIWNLTKKNHLLNFSSSSSFFCSLHHILSSKESVYLFMAAVKPKKGDALLFFSLHPNVTTDPTSYHGSCPVIEGEKWSATKWIHMLPVDEIWRNPDCVDENEHCSAWAKAGECEKNPGYMVGSSLGSKEELGYCRLSCKACSPPS